MAIKVGINGFGRIGRNVLRSAVQNFSDIDIVATRGARHQYLGSGGTQQLGRIVCAAASLAAAPFYRPSFRAIDARIRSSFVTPRTTCRRQPST